MNDNDYDRMSFDRDLLDPDESHYSYNITAPDPSDIDSYSYKITLRRKLDKENINDLKPKIMPGFRVHWSFHSEVAVEWPKYYLNKQDYRIRDDFHRKDADLGNIQGDPL